MKDQPMPNPRNRRTRRFAASAVIALAAGGCHVSHPTPTAGAALDLKALPSLEDTKAQVQAAMNEITAAASNVVPAIIWETANNADIGNCSKPYDQSDGQSAYLPNAIANHVAISEHDWTPILEAATKAAAKLAATDSQVMQNKPGNHDVRFYGPAGISVGIGFEQSLVVTGYTGCRLPRNKK